MDSRLKKELELLDHPKHRYPVGSLIMTAVDISGQVTGSWHKGAAVVPKDSLVVVLGYTQEYTTGGRDQRTRFNVRMLWNGANVVTHTRYAGGEMMLHFKMISDVRNAIDGTDHDVHGGNEVDADGSLDVLTHPREEE